MSVSTSMKRTAFAGEVEMRCSSLNQRCCSSDASGMKCDVKNWRNAGFSWPQPISTSFSIMSALSRCCAGRRAQQPAARIAAVQHEMRHPLWMLHRVGDRDRRALRDAEQRKALEAGRVDDELEIAQPGLEAQILDVPVGKAAAALVVADEPMRARQLDEPVPPDRAVPVELEVAQPVRDLDERRALAGFGVRDARAVIAGAEANRLSGRTHRGRLCRNDGRLARTGRLRFTALPRVPRFTCNLPPGAPPRSVSRCVHLVEAAGVPPIGSSARARSTL